jgi:beta-lactamase superfamily II metal-dependent hydrolase
LAHQSVNTANFDAQVQTWVDIAGNNPAGFTMTPSWVGVIDIGQGSTAAVFNPNGQVIVYYDFGGGSGPNRFTFPDCGQAQLGPRFCHHAAPVFILSHWDWDHWRGAVPAVGTRAIGAINAGALSAAITAASDWAAMAQGMGPLHNAIRNKIYNATNFWERNTVGGIQLHNFGDFDLIRCHYNVAHGGPDNNTGFALRIQDPANGGQYILLPGDAHYPNIQNHNCDQNLDALVATHHGEETVTAVVPRPTVNPSPIAYSFGTGNKYGHPRNGGVASYVARNYSDALRKQTSGRGATNPNYGPRGNVAVRFAGAADGPGIPAALTPNGYADAGVAILAAATTAGNLVRGALTSAQAGRIVATACYQAVVDSGLGYAAALSLVIAQAAGGGMMPQTPMEVRAAIPGAPTLDLANALAEAPAGCAVVAGMGTLAMVGELLANGHSQVAIDLTTIVNGVAAWPPIGTRSARATQRAYAGAGAALNINNLAATLGGLAVATNLSNTFPPLAAPTAANLGMAAAQASFRAARTAIGFSGTNSRSPATVAASVYNTLNGLALANVTASLMAAMAAGAALSPYIPIHPETGIAGALNGAQINTVRDLMKPAIAGAEAGSAMVGANYPDIASVAAAAARAARGAVAGLPQPGCHRHPATCGGNVCTLTMHY